MTTTAPAGSMRIECPAITQKFRAGAPTTERCGRFMGTFEGSYLEPPPCPTCGAEIRVRAVSGMPHVELVKPAKRSPELTPAQTGVDTPHETT